MVLWKVEKDCLRYSYQPNIKTLLSRVSFETFYHGDRPNKMSPAPSHEPSPPSLQEPLLERDLGALGQPVSSTLEPGIDLTHLNHTLYSYDFQPLVTHVWGVRSRRKRVLLEASHLPLRSCPH